MLSFISNSPAQTARAAQIVAEYTEFGDVYLLYGGLGAGKTTFVKAFVDHLGSTSAVTSPTFSIANQYESNNGIIHHLDLYRLDDNDSLVDIDLPDLVDSGIVLIEWGAKAVKELDSYFTVSFKTKENEDSDYRIIEIAASNEKLSKRLENLSPLLEEI